MNVNSSATYRSVYEPTSVSGVAVPAQVLRRPLGAAAAAAAGDMQSSASLPQQNTFDGQHTSFWCSVESRSQIEATSQVYMTISCHIKNTVVGSFLDVTADRHTKIRKNWVPASSDEGSRDETETSR